MMLRLVRCRRIGQNQAFIATIICIPHGALHRSIRRNATEYQIANTPPPQQLVKIRANKGALAGLMDDWLPLPGSDSRDNVGAALANHKMPPKWSCATNFVA